MFFSNTMQLYALNQSNEPVFARQAHKQVDYRCIECGSVVRMRDGIYRQPHFYHPASESVCRLNHKSLTHIQLQLYIARMLPSGEACLEERFPAIGRIADVAWHQEKLIFEVQCSPIGAKEVAERNASYQSQGYQVVWILHERSFNQWRLTAAELFLCTHPHYYSNMGADGVGTIYDQWEWIDKGVRVNTLTPLPVDLAMPYRYISVAALQGHVAKERFSAWAVHFAGDLLAIECNSEHNQKYCQRVLAEERKLNSKRYIPLIIKGALYQLNSGWQHFNRWFDRRLKSYCK